MSDHLTAAAEAMGAPEALVQRSAEARAQATGVSADELLAAWAGAGAIPAGKPPPAAEAAAAPAEEPAAVAEVAPAAEAEPVPETPAAAPAMEEPAPVPPAVPPRPVPETIELSDAADWKTVTSVPTAGLKERTGARMPSWLTSLFVVLPLAAVLYLLQFSSGSECGAAGQLAVDPRTGEVANCDGSPFEGRGTAGGTANFLAVGQTLYADTQVACSGCHGSNGEGGVGPAFTGGAVLATFPSCAEHVQWVQLGSSGWQAQVGPEYGAAGTLSRGGMPGFANDLSDEELRSVVVFERVRFGGADLDEALVDCGLAIPELEEGGEAPADEGGTDTSEQGHGTG